MGLTYGWIFPHGDYASIGIGTISELKSLKSTEISFIELMKNRGIDLTKSNIIKKTAPLYFCYHGFMHENESIFLVGDAASFLWFPTGEGIYQAMKSGELAARKIMGENINKDLKKLEMYSKLEIIIPYILKAPRITEIIMGIFMNIVGNLFGKLESSSFKNEILNNLYFILHPMMHKLAGLEEKNE